jgi:hypothetical protein
MTISHETLVKIARLAGDERGDAATRAVAWAKLHELHELHAEHPEMFVVEAPQIETPDVSDEHERRAPEDPEQRAFFLMKNWGRSSRNPDNLVHVIDGDIIVTVFHNKRHPGAWSWSVKREDQPVVFSAYPLVSELEAMRDAWTNEIAPKRRRKRTS